MLTLGALALSSCVKENDSYKDLLPVQPGMNIYNCAATQNRVAMQAANAGMRVAILAAEVAKQQAEAGEDAAEITLENVKTSDGRVLSLLFNSTTQIEEVADGYELTFKKDSKMPDDFYWEGSLLIETGGAPQLTSGAVWSVQIQPDFKLYEYSYNGEAQINLEGGTTSIVANQDGSCTIQFSHIALSVEESESGASDWSSTSTGFVIRPADENVTLAYSSCKGKVFEVSGAASGASLYANIYGTEPLNLSYSVSEGQYVGLQIVNGTEEAAFTSPLDYDTATYPASDVRCVWGNGQYRIYYNGYVYPKE